MIGLGKVVKIGYDAEVAKTLAAPTAAAREAVRAALHRWLELTRKKSVPDLEDRVLKWARRLDLLADRFSVSVDDGRASVTSPVADDIETLELIQRGTEWFEGCHDSIGLVLKPLCAAS